MKLHGYTQRRYRTGLIRSIIGGILIAFFAHASPNFEGGTRIEAMLEVNIRSELEVNSLQQS